MDQSVPDLLKTEELYKQVLTMVDNVWGDVAEYNPDDFRRALDRILSQGKIIGRRGALKEEFRVPVVGEIWRDKAAEDSLIEITYVISGGPVIYRCGEFSGHSVTVFGFWGNYEPVTPLDDQMIEGWQQIVDGGVS
jgi:hypothetical protein